MVAWVAAARELTLDRVDDLRAFVSGVDHVETAIAAHLTRADVHRRHPEERAFANRGTRITHRACARDHQPDVGFDRKVLVEADVLGGALLSERAHTAGNIF